MAATFFSFFIYIYTQHDEERLWIKWMRVPSGLMTCSSSSGSGCIREEEEEEEASQRGFTMCEEQKREPAWSGVSVLVSARVYTVDLGDESPTRFKYN